MIKRDRQNELYIANMLRTIEKNKRELCMHQPGCDECPLGTIDDLFDVSLCAMLGQTKKRLELSYKLVESL